MTTAIARRIPHSLNAAALALASAVATFALTATPAPAAPRGGLYAATLASPLPEPRREIVGGTVWRCDGDRCLAPADGARAITVCSKVSRRFGALSRFTTPQGEMAAEDLARCNGA